MNDERLIDEMVQRLGRELKDVLGQVRREKISASAIEHVIRKGLWHVGGQAPGVMLEALDRALVRDRTVHDHRTRTIVSLFGPLDVSRARRQDGRRRDCPLDEAMALTEHRSWVRRYRRRLKEGRVDWVPSAVGWSFRQAGANRRNAARA